MRYFGQIEPEPKKTKWNKISDFLSSLFLVYQVFFGERETKELSTLKLGSVRGFSGANGSGCRAMRAKR
jgi:hypothetical protein